MGIVYRFHVGYGFLLPEKTYALPSEWSDASQWYDGDVDNAISGSGLKAVYGGSQWSGEHIWGFVATDTYTTVSPPNCELLQQIRDVDPTVLGNLFDMRSKVKRPKARIGWVMWADIY